MENQMGCETNGKQPHAMEPVKQQLTNNFGSNGGSPTPESSSSPPQESIENHITVRLVGVKEMADILGVPVSWLYENTHKKKIPHVRVGRYLRYSPTAVTEFFKVNYSQIEK